MGRCVSFIVVFDVVMIFVICGSSANAQERDPLLEFVVAEQQKVYDALGERSYHLVIDGTHDYYTPGEERSGTSRYEEISDSKRIWGRFDLLHPHLAPAQAMVQRTFALTDTELAHRPSPDNYYGSLLSQRLIFPLTEGLDDT